MSKPLKVLHVCGSGSAGAWFSAQVRELLELGHAVEVVIPDEGPAADELRGLKVPITVLPFRGYRPRDLPRVLSAWLRLRRYIRRGGFDVVHAHLFKAVIMCRLAVLGRHHEPLVSQIGGVVHLNIPWLRRIDICTLPLDTVTVPSCREFGCTYTKFGARRVRVNHYGIDARAVMAGQGDATGVRASLGLADDDLVFGMIAHMYPSAAYRGVGVKGHEVFLDAARIVSAEAPNARFLLIGDEFVGDGTYRATLEERVADLPAGIIRFLGHRADASRLVASMDVLVVPSLTESASYAAMEGSLGGLPVIASRVGGLPDTVLDGCTGILVRPADPDDLAQAMRALASSPERRRELGDAGRAHVLATMDVRRTVEVLIDIYNEAVG